MRFLCSEVILFGKETCDRIVREMLRRSYCNLHLIGLVSVNIGEEQDAQLLRIVEAYCSGAARAAPVTPDCRPPQLIVAEDEKILVEEVVGDKIIIQEKCVVLYFISILFALLFSISGSYAAAFVSTEPQF